jgi:hypothetical protein
VAALTASGFSNDFSFKMTVNGFAGTMWVTIKRIRVMPINMGMINKNRRINVVVKLVILIS